MSQRTSEILAQLLPNDLIVPSKMMSFAHSSLFVELENITIWLMGSYNYITVKTMHFFVFFIFVKVVLSSGSALLSFNDSILVLPDG